MAQLFVSGMAHFFVVVSGSKIHERVAHFFIDIYMLLYAATDEAIQPDNRYQMSGNKISVRTLDLNRDFSEIAAQLNGIIEEHFS